MATGEITLFVRRSGYDDIIVTVPADAIVADIKRAVEEAGGPSVARQRLSHAGQRLTDPSISLADAGICPETVVDVSDAVCGSRRSLARIGKRWLAAVLETGALVIHPVASVQGADQDDYTLVRDEGSGWEEVPDMDDACIQGAGGAVGVIAGIERDAEKAVVLLANGHVRWLRPASTWNWQQQGLCFFNDRGRRTGNVASTCAEAAAAGRAVMDIVGSVVLLDSGRLTFCNNRDPRGPAHRGQAVAQYATRGTDHLLLLENGEVLWATFSFHGGWSAVSAQLDGCRAAGLAPGLGFALIVLEDGRLVFIDRRGRQTEVPPGVRNAAAVVSYDPEGSSWNSTESPESDTARYAALLADGSVVAIRNGSPAPVLVPLGAPARQLLDCFAICLDNTIWNWITGHHVTEHSPLPGRLLQ